MSNRWQRVCLGEAVTHRKEFISIDDLTNYRRVRARLHARGIVLRDELPGALIKTKQQQVCRAGDFLVAEIDAKVGGFGIVPESLDGCIVSSHYFLFEIDPKLLEKRFLDYFVRTPAFQEQVAAQGSTNYAAIRPAQVLSYEIPLPTLPEQRRVVTKLDDLDAQIREVSILRRRTTEEGDALRASSLRSIMLGCAADAVELSAVCEAIIDNLHSNPIYADTGVPCVRSPDVGWGTLDLVRALRTDESEYRRRTVRGEPRVDDIVLVREGGGTGKCARVLPGQRFSLGQRVMMLRPNRQVIDPRFFLYQLLSPLVQDDQIAPLTKGSASPHLNIKALRRFRLLLPSFAEQRRVVEELDALEAELSALTHLQADTAAELDALLPAILDRAFKGEL